MRHGIPDMLKFWTLWRNQPSLFEHAASCLTFQFNWSNSGWLTGRHHQKQSGRRWWCYWINQLLLSNLLGERPRTRHWRMIKIRGRVNSHWVTCHVLVGRASQDALTHWTLLQHGHWSGSAKGGLPLSFPSFQRTPAPPPLAVWREEGERVRGGTGGEAGGRQREWAGRERGK